MSRTRVGTNSNRSLKLLWEQAVTPLRKKLGADEFESWIRPMSPLATFDGVVEITVPNRMFASWVEENYLDDLAACWAEASGRRPRLRLVWEPQQLQGELFAAPGLGTEKAPGLAQGELFAAPAPAASSPAAASSRQPSTLAARPTTIPNTCSSFVPTMIPIPFSTDRNSKRGT